MKNLMRKRWFVVTLVIVAVVLLGGAGTLQYTTQPGFCASCHIMDPYYETWQASMHSAVACVDCHYAPGEKYKLSSKVKALNQVVQYVTGTYDTKFYTEIKDASCLASGCHSPESIKGDIMFRDRIKFNHDAHYGKSARGMTLRCTTCHSHNIEGDHMAADKNACFLCHFKERVTGTIPVPQQFCLDCHDPPAEDIELEGQTFNHTNYVEQKVDCQRCHIDSVEGQGHVDPNACLQCHDVSEIPTLTSERQDLHNIHVTEHKVDCYRCHSEIRHGAHTSDEQVKFACDQCHTEPHLGPRELYAGIGGRGVDDMPSSMYNAQVDCIGCHMEEFTNGALAMISGEVMRPTVKGCINCHGDVGRDFLDMWTEYLADDVASTSVLVKRSRAALDLADPATADYAKAQKLVEDAEHNLDFVDIGKGIHNFNYSMELLAKSTEFSEEALEMLGAEESGS